MAGVARVYGYLRLAARDGWARFRETAVLPCGGLEDSLVGGELLRMAEGEAKGDAATADEVARMIAARHGEATGAVTTAASVAEELAEAFATRLTWWEGERR